MPTDRVFVPLHVRRLRRARGWSQKELARRLGTQQANVSRLECGLVAASDRRLTVLADVLGVDVCDLMRPPTIAEACDVLPMGAASAMERMIAT